MGVHTGISLLLGQHKGHQANSLPNQRYAQVYEGRWSYFASSKEFWQYLIYMNLERGLLSLTHLLLRTPV